MMRRCFRALRKRAAISARWFAPTRPAMAMVRLRFPETRKAACRGRGGRGVRSRSWDRSRSRSGDGPRSAALGGRRRIDRGWTPPHGAGALPSPMPGCRGNGWMGWRWSAGRRRGWPARPSGARRSPPIVTLIERGYEPRPRHPPQAARRQRPAAGGGGPGPTACPASPRARRPTPAFRRRRRRRRAPRCAGCCTTARRGRGRRRATRALNGREPPRVAGLGGMGWHFPAAPPAAGPG